MSQNSALNELWCNKGSGGANSPEPLLLVFKSMDVHKHSNIKFIPLAPLAMSAYTFKGGFTHVL